MNDQFFTPPKLVESVVGAVSVRRVRCVADFAAGHGDLLNGIKRRWSKCKVVAADIDRICVDKLKHAWPAWKSVRCDFLNGKAREASAVLGAVVGKCDVIVLNPPFSGRGGRTVAVAAAGKEMRCSRAMAFVVVAVEYLRPDGQLLAILPASCKTSIKDRLAREYCDEYCEVTHIETFARQAFSGCAAKTILVKLQRRKNRRKKSRTIRCSRQGYCAERLQARIVRGCIPVFRAENGLAGAEFPFIHTTDLQGQYVEKAERSIRLGNRAVVGPALLLSRVGSPSTQKCAVYGSRKPIVLSDCVIALECKTKDDAAQIRKRLIAKWRVFADSYNGTCAPYITIDALKNLLRRWGIDAS